MTHKQLREENEKMRETMKQISVYAEQGVKDYNALAAQNNQLRAVIGSQAAEIKRLQNIVNNIENNTDHD